MSTALTKFFFRAPYSPAKTGEIIRWWESRRPAYNLAVGAAGLLSYAAITLFELLRFGRDPTLPLGLILVYGILANLFYCLGPVVDTIVMRGWGRDYSEVGPTLFRYGFVFAVGLTLLPLPLLAIRVVLWMVLGV